MNMWCVLYTSFANFCELLAMEVILMYFYLSIFAECEPLGIISALAWRIMYGVIAKNVKLDSLVSRIRKQFYLNLHRQQCLCTVKLISELWYIMHYVVFLFSCYVGPRNNVVMVELWGILKGLQIAISKGFLSFQIHVLF
jgi:hypothetical protein